MITMMVVMMILISIAVSRHLCMADTPAGESESPDCWTNCGVVTMETRDCGVAMETRDGDCVMVSMVSTGVCWHVCGGWQ